MSREASMTPRYLGSMGRQSMFMPRRPSKDSGEECLEAGYVRTARKRTVLLARFQGARGGKRDRSRHRPHAVLHREGHGIGGSAASEAQPCPRLGDRDAIDLHGSKAAATIIRQPHLNPGSAPKSTGRAGGAESLAPERPSPRRSPCVRVQ